MSTKRLSGGRRPQGHNEAAVEPANRISPEGPYETGRTELDGRPAKRDLFCFPDLILAIQDVSQATLGLRQGERELRMITELVRSHDLGRIVTSTSLAASSGLTYGTAMRAIDDLVQRGLIVKRAKTETDRSFSLHPSLDLLARWQRFARTTEELMRRRFVADAASGSPPRATKADPTVIAPLPVLDAKLPLGRALRVLVHADPTFTAMNALRRHFEMVLGVPIASRAVSIDRLRAEIITNSRRAVSNYDIVACDLPWFGEMAQANRFIALDSVSAHAPLDAADIYPDALASSRFRGRPYGVPIMTTAEMLVYRTDLADKAGVEPPRTTEALVAAARRLHTPSRGISGIAWNGGRGTPVGHTFIMTMSAFGRPILNLRRTADGFDAERIEGEQMRPAFLSPEARETAAYLLELKAFSPPDVLQMAWYDRAVAYARGRAAMAYSHTLLAPLFEVDAGAAAYRRAGYLPHPAGPRGRPIVPMGGYALAIPTNIAPERVAPVWNALRTLTSASASKLYLVNGSLASPRVSVSKDPDIRALSPVIGAVDEFNRQGIFRMWPRRPHPASRR
ncbi:ABC transporter substrate-binding protein [Lichenifustis flavocetrariae]|uniref:Extracellular solute-binding protein n=1 Tax=Lichenifustis flavocetrariae TaxID=2949735 RepID=A0AA41YUF0_9HYPH|nr:extracellular solute-binding protein [Lichenifustis flavocetrariae]MCW6508766.1 extracellular solute-binding protein [Lichenifustis flavocetrariae]